MCSIVGMMDPGVWSLMVSCYLITLYQQFVVLVTTCRNSLIGKDLSMTWGHTENIGWIEYNGNSYYALF